MVVITVITFQLVRAGAINHHQLHQVIAWRLKCRMPVNKFVVNTISDKTSSMTHAWFLTLTLSQWSSSGNREAIQCAWNLDPIIHWNAAGKKLVASVLPVAFQWSSSGFPVVFQCVPVMQINTRLPLERHWVLASASDVPVASQCTCGSSGLPMCSNYTN